jgi:PTH2 family peptidyl-tRNA hydrolase
MNKVKQVIVIRKDLNMRKGKMVAQGAHSSMKIFFDKMKLKSEGANSKTFELTVTSEEASWIEGLFTKICVSVNSEQELLAVYEEAKKSGILCSLIQDAGLTEFGGVPTYTSVSIGPAESEKIDKITGKLPLL